MPFDSRYHKWISGSSFPKSESRRVNTIILPRSADSRSPARPPSSSVSEGSPKRPLISLCRVSAADKGLHRGFTSCRGVSKINIRPRLFFPRLFEIEVYRCARCPPLLSLPEAWSLALPLTFPLSLSFSLFALPPRLLRFSQITRGTPYGPRISILLVCRGLTLKINTEVDFSGSI